MYKTTRCHIPRLQNTCSPASNMVQFAAPVITDPISWSLCQHNTQKLNRGGCLGRSVCRSSGFVLIASPPPRLAQLTSSSTQTVTLERQGILPLRGGKQPQSTPLARVKIADLCLTKPSTVPTEVENHGATPCLSFFPLHSKAPASELQCQRPETLQSRVLGSLTTDWTPASFILSTWKDFSSSPQSSQLSIMKMGASKRLPKRYC